ncbi:hypothetical protein BDV59DRAFT_206642 [Aspergillus ambiguus]|uniref:uncharacterized protein n=1 Tax=Aspergillus ambiguus TaxID=176160 RepID=UPI003CCD211C
MKLRSQSTTWADMQSRFQELRDRTVNRDYVREAFFDIGKETCPITSNSEALALDYES